MLGRVAAGFTVIALFVGTLAWGILVFQTIDKWDGNYCEDYAACYGAKPLELTVQGTIALVGVAAGIGIAIRCLRYALGGDPPGLRQVLLATVVVVCLAAWLLYTDAAGVNAWRQG